MARSLGKALEPPLHAYRREDGKLKGKTSRRGRPRKWVKALRAPRREKRPAPDTVVRVFEALLRPGLLDPHRAHLLQFSMLIGVPWATLNNLKRDDAYDHVERGYMEVDGRRIVLDHAAESILRAQVQLSLRSSQPTDLVFVGRYGGPIANLSNSWRRACEAAGESEPTKKSRLSLQQSLKEARVPRTRARLVEALSGDSRLR